MIHFLAVEVNLAAGVGLMIAGDDLDQGRFAGAVVAEQTDDLSRVDLEIDVLE